MKRMRLLPLPLDSARPAVAAAAVAAALFGASLAAGMAAADDGPESSAAPSEQGCATKLADLILNEFPSVEKADTGQDRENDPLGEHLKGQAVDVLIDNYTAPEQIELGDAIVNRIHELSEYPIDYTLWRQTYRPSGDHAPLQMEDRGNATQNNLDHIHIGLTTATC